MKNKFFLLIILLISVSSVFSQIAIVGNKNLNLEIKAIQDVIDIYSLETQKAKDGTALVLFALKNDTKDVLYQKLGKTSTEFKKIWMKAQLSGDGVAPTFLDSEKDVISNVAGAAGGVGFVNETSVTPDVKVLFILK